MYWAILFSIGLFASCSTAEIEEEVGLEDNLELKSTERPKGPRLPPVPPPPLPGPCGFAFNCLPKY
ncbi:hypothetical protein [uncultured Aquimarina sp.]|uniref:hypothetical protein n=1 Tax=uncultured Aquimarina sp. TaxID=575652 RepID=UPI002607ECC0|nr:hypothetical protein [uncultured Aquimarina sp.]